MALLEYGQAGLATVATDVGQCAETIAYGRTGIVVQSAAPQVLADALIRLLRSPGKRARLGEAFRRRVEEFYGPEHVVGQVCRIYRMVLSSRGSEAK